MFGTDIPFREDIDPQLRDLEALGLSDAERRAIDADNAARLLGISLQTSGCRYDGEDLNDLFNELWFQDTSMCSQCDHLPIPKVSLYSLVNSLKLGPTISGLTTR